MHEVCNQDEVCDGMQVHGDAQLDVQGGIQDDVRVQDEDRSDVLNDDRMSAKPNDSLRVAELSQLSSANTLSSANMSKESASTNHLSASFRNIRCKTKTKFKVKTVSRRKFTLSNAKGSPASREKLEDLDNNTQTAADKVHNIVKNINQKQTHNFRGAINKVNNLSTPTK